MRIMKTPGNWIGSALCSLATVTQAGASPIDGIWEAVLAGNTHMIALVERSDGRLLGYVPSSPGSWVVGGQRIGSAVTINLDARDPVLSSDPATFTGIRRGSHIDGTLTDSTGTTAVTLDEVHAPRTVAHWLMGPSTSGDVLNRAIRVENNAGRFVAGGFVGLTDCSFLACGGHITSWTVAGTAHAILTDSGGACPSTSALAGTWDVATLLVNGTYTTAASCPPPPAGGRFFGGKEGTDGHGRHPRRARSAARFCRPHRSRVACRGGRVRGHVSPRRQDQGRLASAARGDVRRLRQSPRHDRRRAAGRDVCRRRSQPAGHRLAPSRVASLRHRRARRRRTDDDPCST